MRKNKLDQSLCDTLSWRGLLCQRHGMINQNFSAGGSSNQRQFRLAMEFFGSELYDIIKKSFDKIIVLWGITSTARNELWCLEQNAFHNFFLTNGDDHFANFMIKHSYDHDAEVHGLRNLMLFWNRFFQDKKIKNFWFDTFNTHNYEYDFLSQGRRSYIAQPRDVLPQQHYEGVAGPDWPSWTDFNQGNFDLVPSNIMQEINLIFDRHTGTNVLVPGTIQWLESDRQLTPIHNLIDHDRFPRDLMSWLMQQHGISIDATQQEFHHSEWKIDRDSMQQLVDLDLLNPHSFHPTRTAHKLFCEFFSNKLGTTLE